MHAISIALLLLAAVPSLQPYYTPGDKVLDENIVGVWQTHEVMWAIEPNAGRTDYTLTVNAGLGGMYTVTIFKVGDERFLDIQPIATEMIEDEFLSLHVLPAHSLFRVWVREETLRIAPFDHEKLEVMLTQQPGLIPHVFIERGKGVQPQLVLTGSTAQLKSLFEKNIDTLFAQPMSLRRDFSAPLPPPVLQPPAEDEETTVSLAPRRGVSLNSAQAAMRAARYANDEAEKNFGSRPFRPSDFSARLDGHRWQWGDLERPVVNGYSAEVTMDRNGTEADIKVQRMAEREQVQDAETPIPPSVPIVPKY